jgi:hypothetical protein
VKLSDKHLEVITRAAALAAIEHLEQEKKKQEKLKHDRRLRNIKLLLRNYRSFVKHCEEIKIELNELDEMFDLAELASDELKVMSIKKSKEKTLAIVKFLNKMLKIYKIMCVETGKQEDARRYNTIYLLHISEEKKTVEEISAMQKTAVRTIYNDVERACKDLAVLVFGVDGIRF